VIHVLNGAAVVWLACLLAYVVLGAFGS